MTDKSKYPKHYKCKWCGCEITLLKPWEGRPQGPRCQCTSNSWGNWMRIQNLKRQRDD